MSNPFRKRAGGQADDRFPAIEAIDTSVASTPPPPTSFRWKSEGVVTIPSDGHSDPAADRPASAGDKKPKVVKKVRVLSPPPLSPDSPEWPYNAPPPPQPQQQQSQQTQQTPFPHGLVSKFAGATPSDPFINNIVNDNNHDSTAAPPPPPPKHTPHGLAAPQNPFTKTLDDAEAAKKLEGLKEERREEAAALKAANAARGSLNVDAFQRLLMTGQANDSSDSIQPDTPSSESPSGPSLVAPVLDRATVSFGSSKVMHIDHDGDQDEMSDSSTTVQIWDRKKAPPPPPSSRHGRSIKPDDIRDASPTASRSKPVDLATRRTPSDTVRSGESSPEIESEHATAHRSSAAAARPLEADAEPSSGSKKPVPAPPPRRGHARAESKANANMSKEPKEGEAQARSSLDSATSPPGSIKQPSLAPAPPPPRRGLGNRPTSFQPSPTAAAFIAAANHVASTPSQEQLQSDKSPATPSTSTSLSTPTPPQATPSSPPEPVTTQDPSAGQVKLSAPPRPPARNPSTRRPPSSSSSSFIDPQPPSSSSRNTSGPDAKTREGQLHPPPPPPPPPTRRRGNSKSSIEGPPPRAAADPSRVTPDVPEEPVVSGLGDNILADLESLQREVDALRGKLG